MQSLFISAFHCMYASDVRNWDIANQVSGTVWVQTHAGGPFRKPNFDKIRSHFQYLPLRLAFFILLDLVFEINGRVLPYEFLAY